MSVRELLGNAGLVVEKRHPVNTIGSEARSVLLKNARQLRRECQAELLQG